jgi:type I restriction enzyme S subunit
MRQISDTGWFDILCNKSTIAHLTSEKLCALALPLPPLDERETIARFLDYKTKQIDDLIAKKEALIEKLDEKRTALISHAVTKGLDPSVPMKDSGIEWLGEIPEHWNILSIKIFSEIYDCKHKTVSFVDDGLPVASIAQVQNFYIDLSVARQTTKEEFADMIEGGREPQNGDVIFSRNATVGASAIVRNNIFCMGQDVCLIRPIKTNSILLNYNFRAFFIKSQIDTYLLGSTFKRINVEEVKNMLICLPPLEEQEKIAKFIDKKTAEIDQQKAKIQKAIGLLKEYRTALITNAVTGKIDRCAPSPHTLTPETRMTQITLTELPETFQNLINQAQKTGEPLTIIQNGIASAIISPIKKKSLLETLSTLNHWTKTFPTWTPKLCKTY